MTLIPLPEAARRLGYHPKSVRRALQSQGIPLHRERGVWYVREEDLARAEKRPPGRPRAPLLVEQIKKHGLPRVARAADDAAVGTVLGLRDGLDVTGWAVTQATGAVLFTRYEGETPVEGVLCLYLDSNDPEAESFRSLAAEAGFPVTVLFRDQMPDVVPY